MEKLNPYFGQFSGGYAMYALSNHKA